MSKPRVSLALLALGVILAVSKSTPTSGQQDEAQDHFVYLPSIVVPRDVWAMEYGLSGPDKFTAFFESLDGNLILAGNHHTQDLSLQDGWIVSLWPNGEIAWQQHLGGPQNETLYAIDATPGGFVAAGVDASFGAGLHDAWVIKFGAPDGNLIWQKAYGGPQWDQAKAIASLDDGSIAVAGVSQSFSGGDTDAWILRLAGDGTVLWQKAYGGEGQDFALAMTASQTGGFVFAGYSDSFGTGDFDIWVVKVTINGQITWQKRYDKSAVDLANAIIEADDGSIVVVGTSDSARGDDNDIWILRLDQGGDVLWQKIVGSSDSEIGTSIIETRAGNFLVGAYQNDYQNPGKGLMLMLATDGSLLWQKQYDDMGHWTVGPLVAEMSSGRLALTGNDSGWGPDERQGKVWVLDDEGDIGYCSAIRPAALTLADTSTIPQNTNASIVDTNAVVTDIKSPAQTGNATWNLICPGPDTAACR